MNVHQRLHGTPAEDKDAAKVHICKFCKTGFARQSKLKQHLQTKHRVIQPLVNSTANESSSS